MKSLLTPGSWIIYPWQEAYEDTFPVVQLGTWMIFLITAQEYARSYCKNQHVGTEIITEFWCLDQVMNCSLVPCWLSSTSVSPPLGQWWLGPPGPNCKMMALPKCFQPFPFRVEGVGTPWGRTTNQSGLHEQSRRAGERHRGDILSPWCPVYLYKWVHTCLSPVGLSEPWLCLNLSLCSHCEAVYKLEPKHRPGLMLFVSNKGSAGAWSHSRHHARSCWGGVL